ncbi:MAG: aldo/keto reductase [Candidatus Saccharimonadales bacterium]
MDTIPQLGLGLWKITDEQEFDIAVKAAIDAGYRHFDTAQIYGNEKLLGSAWKSSGIPRDELFLTTKISVHNFGYSRAKKSFETSLQNLQTEYVDLLLLHFPVSFLRKNTWSALVDIQQSGSARHIGVSNYTIRHLKELKQQGLPTPHVNQVELHLFLQQPELVDYCNDNQIILEAYSPLAHGKEMNNPIITNIAKQHGVSYAQVMLRWCIEQGFIILPKSVNPDRIRQNKQVLDFSLTPDDLLELKKLDKNMRTCWNPTFVP